MSYANKIIIVVFVAYMLFTVGLGLFFLGKTRTNKDYVLGGRELNPWVTALSAQASDMSGWLLTGIPGAAFIAYAAAQSSFVLLVGLFIGTWLNWIFVAKRLRVYTEVAGDSLTIPEYFMRRFDDKSGILGVVSGAIILLFFTVYTASMFSAGAKVFHSVFGAEYKIGLLIGVLIIVSYTFFGGFKAVSWTDLFQGMIMFISLIVVPLVLIGRMNSSQQAQVGEYIGNMFATRPTGSDGVYVIISSLGWGLGYFGMPHILVRFMGAKDKRTIKPARKIALIWVSISMCAALLVGIVGHVLVDQGILITTNSAGDITINRSEEIFMYLVKNNFKPFFAGVLLTAILAAIMSTADSQLLVAASAFSTDIYKKKIRKNAHDKEILSVSRITIIIVSIIAAAIALDENSSIFKLVEFAWGGFGASFGPVILFSLYSKKVKKSAAISSMIVGTVTALVFKFGLSKFGGFFTIYEIVPGFILATITLLLVSYIDKRSISENMEKDFDKFIALMNASKQEDIELKREEKELKEKLKNIQLFTNVVDDEKHCIVIKDI